MPPIRGRSGETPLESFLKPSQSTFKIIQNGSQNGRFSDQSGPQSHAEPPKWSPERSKTPPRCPKEGPRVPIWNPKWAQGPFQGAKGTPRRYPWGDIGLHLGGFGGAVGDFWDHFGHLWASRGHFSCKAPEPRKTNESIGKA